MLISWPTNTTTQHWFSGLCSLHEDSPHAAKKHYCLLTLQQAGIWICLPYQVEPVLSHVFCDAVGMYTILHVYLDVDMIH